MKNGKEILDNITIKYGKFKKIFSALESTNLNDDAEISFEFIIGSCFPDIMKNIKESLNFQYTKGYTDGLKSKKKRKK